MPTYYPATQAEIDAALAAFYSGAPIPNGFAVNLTWPEKVRRVDPDAPSPAWPGWFSDFVPGPGQIVIGSASGTVPARVSDALRLVPSLGAVTEPAVMANPPTLSLGAAGVSSISGGVLVPYNDPAIRVYQGWATAVAAFGGPINAWQGSGITSPSSTPPYTVDFVTDAAVVELYVKGGGGSIHVWVDGQPASAGWTAVGPPDGNPYYLAITFSTARRRRIAAQCYLNPLFLGVQRPPTATVWPATMPLGPKVIAIGDSYTEATGDTDGANVNVWGGGYVARLADTLGWPDIRQSGSGGTGYLNPGSGGRVKFRDRVQNDVIAPNPDIVIVAGGLNDETYATASAVGTEAAALFDAIKTGLPNATLIVVGPWWKSGSPSANILAIRDAVQSAAASRARLFIDPIAGSWITGSGHVGALANDGNADVYISSDGTHPTSAGHTYLAYRLASAIAAAMPF